MKEQKKLKDELQRLNISKAGLARKLDISRQALYRKLNGGIAFKNEEKRTIALEIKKAKKQLFKSKWFES